MAIASITLKKNSYTLGLIFFCLAYLLCEYLCISYIELSADEFFFANHIFKFITSIPYKDFLPYKTVVGYYLLTPGAYLANNTLSILFNIKFQIAIINCTLIALCVKWSFRFFSQKAVLATLLLITTNQLFLIYSVDLRVDMLTSWAGLIAVLLCLSKRINMAGFATGVAFLISQKALWFVFAILSALGLTWLLFERTWQDFRKILLFTSLFLITILSYIVLWSTIAEPTKVLQSVFLEGYLQAKINWYSNSCFNYWQAILMDGPLLILLWPYTWISFLACKTTAEKKQHFLIGIFCTINILCVWFYKQAFPYNTVFLFPAFFLLFSNFFTWLQAAKENKIYINTRVLFWFSAMGTIFIVSNLIRYGIFSCYYLIAFLPTIIGLLIYYQEINLKNILFRILLCIIIISGITFPLVRLIHIIISNNGSYQRDMASIATELSKQDGNFFAGMPVLHDKDQAIPGLKNLIGPAIQYLYFPQKTLEPILIESLYMKPQTQSEIMNNLIHSKVKFYVNNSRILSLPKPIKKYLKTEFQQYLGSIYIYAPQFSYTERSIKIKFDGRYLLESSDTVYIDNKPIYPHSIAFLRNGIHTAKSASTYRLKLLPNEHSLRNYSSYTNDLWWLLIRPITY